MKLFPLPGLFTLASLTLTTCLGLACTQAQSQTMFGRYDCGEWTKGVNRYAAERWLSGYLSGLNTAHGFAGMEPKDPLGDLNSLDQAIVWVDNFCKSNPLKGLHQAGYALYVELRTKGRR